MTASDQAVRPHQVSFDAGTFVRPVHRFRWVPVPVPPAAEGSAPARRLLVLGADSVLAEEVAGRLRELGHAARVCPDGSAADPCDGIVDLNVTGRPYSVVDDDDDAGAGGVTAWRAPLAHTTRTVQRQYREWGADVRANHRCYVVVTALGGRMGYDGTPGTQPLGGIWAGFAKSLLRELPNLAVKVVDVQVVDPATVATAVHAELGAWDQFEVGYRDGVRYVLEARRQDVGTPRFDLSDGDVVLVSGGARGVGFAFARGLAERFGCRIVVTGRSPLPAGAGWLTMDDAAFATHQRDRVAQARSAEELRTVRSASRRDSELRTVHANLSAARRDGLRIDYEPCDCADPRQVAALFAKLPAPTVIVHNAGIDEPKRLDAKAVDEVLRTVEVKVGGFANLLREVLRSPERRSALRMFCNVGSLAGRLGGMIGQVDYAAGNEALARLGFWAGATHGLPVQTLCWPTWERLGVITNYDTAIRYVSTIAPADGVQRWIDEIRAGGTGEAMFIGQIGAALVPSMLHGFARFTGHPDLPRLHSLAHFLGDVEIFEPFGRLRSAATYRPGTHPCLNGEFRVDGAVALPPGVLVEKACAAADWVVPPGWPRQHLAGIHDLVVHLDRLRLAPDGTRLVTHAEGAATADGWVVRVRITGTDGVPVLTARLVYTPDPPALTDDPPALTDDPAGETDPAQPSGSTSTDAPAGGRFEWDGLVVIRPQWTVDAAGRRWSQLSPVTAADLWTVPFPPAPGIAPAALEAAFGAAVRMAASRPDATRLSLRTLVACPGAQHVDRLSGSADASAWMGTAAGRPVLRIEGLTVG